MTALLEIRDLVKTFRAEKGEVVRAVDGVSLSVRRGQTYGLVGESGSGKSTLARCALRLVRPDSGTVLFDGEDITAMPAGRLRRLRSRVQVVFQDPHGSLNPGHTVGAIIAAPLAAHGVGRAAERRARVEELMDLVQLPRAMAGRRPRELSGGQAQRVAIARALALRPEFVVLDEAVSALDVSVRAQVLNLLTGLQRELGLTYLFISHDLAVVRYMASDICVMYQGRVVEEAPREHLFATPRHPYTRMLLRAVPVADPAVRPVRDDGEVLDGEVPQDACRFLPRCAVGVGRVDCAAEEPQLLQLQPSAGRVACHHPGGTV